jgi:hypothetical protein
MSIILSWGRYGGFYCHSGRLCLGWVAVTVIGREIDDVIEEYLARRER